MLMQQHCNQFLCLFIESLDWQNKYYEATVNIFFVFTYHVKAKNIEREKKQLKQL